MELSASFDEVKALAERISHAVKASGGGASVARNSGIPLRTLGKYMAADAVPSSIALAKIAHATSTTLDWLAGLSAVSGHSIAPSDAASEMETVLIPILDVRAAAGVGVFNDDEQIVAHLPFPRGFLRALGVSPDKVRAIRSAGDSMEPTIPDDRLVLINTADRDISRSKIFVLRTADGLRLKRVHRTVDGSIILISDNKELYEPERLSEDEAATLKVIGRAFWTERLI